MIGIRKARFPRDVKLVHRIIRDSFITVADDFGLTAENCPSNPAFISLSGVSDLENNSRELFILSDDRVDAGFVAIEECRTEKGMYFIEKLSVLPAYRHRGFGELLMNFAGNRIYEKGGTSISIGIIHENTVLKQWYKSLGYSETSLKKFDHLPFTVCFMKKEL